jgi:hypothetical protein
MAILWVREHWEGRKAGETEENRVYSRVFKVVTSSVEDGPKAVKDAVGVRIGDVYRTATEIDPRAFCVDVNAQHDQSDPNHWEVSCDYDTSAETNDAQKDQQKEEQQSDDPEDEPPQIGFQFRHITRPVERDKDGKPIANSAGEKFDPPLEVDESIPVITITRNEKAFNASLAIDYEDAVNADVWSYTLPGGSTLIARKGQAKIENIGAQTQSKKGQLYYSVTYEIGFRREGWQVEKLDQGFFEKDANNLGMLQHIKVQVRDENNKVREEFCSAPHPLDGAGHKLQKGRDLVFLPFKVYKELPFAALRL